MFILCVQVSFPESHVVGMLGEMVPLRIVPLVEIQAKPLCFKAKFLIEKHGRVVHGHVECDVFTGTALDEVVEHDATDSRSLEVWMNDQKRNVCLVDLYVWGHERTTDEEFSEEHYAREVRILEALGQVHWPEKLRDEAVHRRHVVLLEVAKVNRSGRSRGRAIDTVLTRRSAEDFRVQLCFKRS